MPGTGLSTIRNLALPGPSVKILLGFSSLLPPSTRLFWWVILLPPLITAGIKLVEVFFIHLLIPDQMDKTSLGPQVSTMVGYVGGVMTTVKIFH